jgi:Flp pilus assembly protein TadG
MNTLFLRKFPQGNPARLRGERGATLVEFAVVAPLLLMMFFAIVDFGTYFFIQHTVQFATREGVRLALVGGTLNDSEGGPLGRKSSIVARIQEKAAIAMDPGELQISIYPINTSYGDPDDWRDTQDAGSPGQYMRVRSRYEYPFITPLIRAMVPNGTLLVQAEATYKNELFD